MLALVQDGLKIDWTRMPTYNTIMSVAAGAGLLMVVSFGRDVLRDPEGVDPESWAVGFGIVGVILAVTGAHMTLTWPLAVGFPFDNIIFGEPSLAFGVLLLGAAVYLWQRGATVFGGAELVDRLMRMCRPVSVFVAGMGLGAFGIAAAGVTYQLFAAPPEEPISGAFADQPMLEAVAISGLYALVGVGAVLFPFALRRGAPRIALWRVIGIVWAIAGAVFLLFGALNYFTHIGLIVHTM